MIFRHVKGFIYAPTCRIRIRPILVRTYLNSKTWWNHLENVVKYLATCPTKLSYSSWASCTSVKETPCEDNKKPSPWLSRFTSNIRKQTLQDLKDWRVRIYNYLQGFIFLISVNTAKLRSSICAASTSGSSFSGQDIRVLSMTIGVLSESTKRPKIGPAFSATSTSYATGKPFEINVRASMVASQFFCWLKAQANPSAQ